MYGPLPTGTRHRPESLFALGERQRGVDIPRIPCPLLVVAGGSYPVARGSDVVDHYGGELIEFPDLDHAGLVREPEVVAAIADWLTRLGNEPPSASVCRGRRGSEAFAAIADDGERQRHRAEQDQRQGGQRRAGEERLGGRGPDPGRERVVARRREQQRGR